MLVGIYRVLALVIGAAGTLSRSSIPCCNRSRRLLQGNLDHGEGALSLLMNALHGRGIQYAVASLGSIRV